MYSIGIDDLLEGQVLGSSITGKNNAILYKAGSLLTEYSIYNIRQSFNKDKVFNVLTFDELKPRLSNDSILASKYISFITGQFGDYFNSSFIGVTNLVDLSNRLTSCLIRNSDVLNDLILVKYSHEYTYNHCINVAILSLQIGLSLGVSDNELQALALGSMLHDLGKVVIPSTILDKPSKLSDSEFSLIKKHPEAGCLIADRCDLNSTAYAIINEHHEKLDGTGYPNNKVSSNISDMSKIVAVSDIFDAVTSARSYHRAASTSKGVKILLSESSSGKISSDVVTALKDKLILYPLNTFVKLSNNKTGYVIGVDKTGLRPVVYDLLNNKTYDLCEDLSLDILYAV